jgi:hypothetical protein
MTDRRKTPRKHLMYYARVFAVNPLYHTVGFQFLDLPPEAPAVIARIVEQFGFRDN